MSRNFRFSFQPAHTVYPIEGFRRTIFTLAGAQGLDRGPIGPNASPELLTATFPSGFGRHPSVRWWSGSIFRPPQPRLSRRKRQPGDPPEHVAKQPFRQMALRQQQPIIAGMFHQPSSRLHQPLLQTRQRPVLDSLGQRQPPPQIPQVVGQQAQRQPHLVRAETMAREASHLYGLLALLDPLLCRTPLVVKPHYRPARGFQVGHDESDSREQLPGMKLHFRHHTPRRLPTGRLIEKALVPDHRLVTRSSHWPRQQLRDVALQAIVGGYANGILHASFLQRLVNLRLGKGRVGTKDYLFAQSLLSLNLRQ